MVVELAQTSLFDHLHRAMAVVPVLGMDSRDVPGSLQKGAHTPSASSCWHQEASIYMYRTPRQTAFFYCCSRLRRRGCVLLIPPPAHIWFFFWTAAPLTESWFILGLIPNYSGCSYPWWIGRRLRGAEAHLSTKALSITVESRTCT